MFIGRERELLSLQERYDNGKFHFFAIYGRRRVGKTALIKEFIKGKKAIFFSANEVTAKDNLEELSAQIRAVLGPDFPKVPFSSFKEAFSFVFERASNERMIFVIDEYPYLAESYRGVSSYLQHLIDEHHQDNKLFLILCGSSMSFMEYQVMGYKSPLYGRRSGQLKMRPFDYIKSAEFLKGFDNKDKIILYSITGGIPEYLKQIDCSLSVKENVEKLFFTEDGRLFEEPSNLLKQELREPQTYNSIVSAISEGRTKLNEIATRVGIETSQCSNMLVNLINLGLVRKEIPITESITSKKTIYYLNDFMFVFWYRFVRPNLNRIILEQGNKVCDEVFSKQLSSHVGFIFEACTRQYMWQLMREGKIYFKDIGRWWGNNPKLKQEEEIDFIAVDEERAIFGECKWQERLTSEDVLNELVRKSELLTKFTDCRYMLFSKSGFTVGLTARAKEDERVRLVGVDDMF